MKPIDILTNGAHSRSIEAGTCTMCPRDAVEFRNAKSIREHSISGMCQTCQDSVFGTD